MKVEALAVGERSYIWDKRLWRSVEVEPGDSRLSGAKRRQCRGERGFIRGPIPLAWMQRTCRLPGKAPQLGLALWYIHGLTNRVSIKLTRTNLVDFGLQDRGVFYRAVEALEGANLIRVIRRPGQTLELALVLDEPPPD